MSRGDRRAIRLVTVAIPATGRGAAGRGPRASGSIRSAAGGGPSPIRIGRSSARPARRPWLPRTRLAIERDHVEQGAEAQLLLQEPRDRPALGPEQIRVEEQLAGVVAGLAVDVDGPGEIGGQAVVEPVGIGEPGVGLGQRRRARRREDDPGRARAARRPPAPARRRASRRSASRTRARSSGSGDVDVGKLVVADGEGPAAEGVEDLAERARAGPRAARPRGARDSAGSAGSTSTVAVLADDPDPRPDGSGGVEQRGAGVVQLADQPGHVAAGRAEPLGVVVEVRQVDQRQVGPLRFAAPRPTRGRSSRCRGARRPVPRRCGTGSGPGRASSRSQSPSGVPVMPKTLLPSAP